MARHPSGVFVGLAMIVVGLALLATQLGVSIGFEVDARTARYWPVLLLAFGALRLITSEARRGWSLIFLAGVLLMHTLDVVPLTQSWPLFIVSAGVGLLARRDTPSCGREAGRS